MTVFLSFFMFLLPWLNLLVGKNFFHKRPEEDMGGKDHGVLLRFKSSSQLLYYSENFVDYKLLIRVKRDSKLSGHLGSLWEDSRQMLLELKPQIVGSVVQWILATVLWGYTSWCMVVRAYSVNLLPQEASLLEAQPVEGLWCLEVAPIHSASFFCSFARFARKFLIILEDLICQVIHSFLHVTNNY